MTELPQKPKFVDLLMSFLIMAVSAALVIGTMLLVLFFENKERYGEVLLGGGNDLAVTVAFSVLIFVLLYVFLNNIFRSALLQRKQLIMLCCIIVISTLLNLLITLFAVPFLRVYALAAILGAMLFDRKAGILTGAITVLLTLTYDYMNSGFQSGDIQILFTLVYGLISITLGALYVRKSAKRYQAVIVALRLGVPCIIALFFVQYAFGMGATEAFAQAVTTLIGCFFSVLVYLAILPLFEIAFNIITVYRLDELTDHNNELLVRLRTEAPGTYNHVLVVSNLAEACAIAIGEDPHLTRAAAYYHDIGKLYSPEYYKENQSEDRNPHDDITPEASVNIIKDHATRGYLLAKQHRLPEEIATVCREHHGTLHIRYFYYQAQKYSETRLDVKGFCYDGPKPQSRIAAIIMICDAAEAAVRASKDHSTQNVERIVRTLIEERMQFDQFTECAITLKEIYTIKDTVVSNYADLEHERVEYPKINIIKPTE